MGVGGVKDWRDGMHYSVYDKYSVVLDFMEKKHRVVWKLVGEKNNVRV